MLRILLCQIFHPSWCCKSKYGSNPTDMAKVAIKSEKLSPFGGVFPIMEQFDSKLSSVIDSTLSMRCRLVWLSIKRNHPFGFERLFLWRHMHRGHDLLLSAPTAAVRSTITSLRSEGGRRRNWAALSMN